MNAFRDSNEQKGRDSADLPEVARQLAGQLADAFEQDRTLAEQLIACQDRLRAANGQRPTVVRTSPGRARPAL
jgi:hypothetical protein